MIDAGTSQNRVIQHTEIFKVSGTEAELSKVSDLIFKKMSAGCENEAGCSADFNTYDSMEKAQAALQRCLKRAYKNRTILVKLVKP